MKQIKLKNQLKSQIEQKNYFTPILFQITLLIFLAIIIIILLYGGLNNQILNRRNLLKKSISKLIFFHSNYYKTDLFTIKYIQKSKKFAIQNPQLKKQGQKVSYYLQKFLKLQQSPLQYSNISQQQLQNGSKLRNLIDDPNNQDIISEQYNYYESKYEISKYTQLPFCIVIASYNNANNDRYKRNLISILQQNYSNYHVIYVDDFSPDGTFQKVKQFINGHPKKDYITVIQNNNNQGALASFLNAIDKCKPNQIVLRIDGDDQILGKQVFKLFNSIYQSKKVSVAYSNAFSIEKNQLKVAFSRPYPQEVIQNRDYRYYFPVFFHQASYYAQLAQKVNINDLKDSQNKLYRYASDRPISIPILQMADKNIFYINQVTYFYNTNTGINENKFQYSATKQIEVEFDMKMKMKYNPINKTL